MFTKCQILIAFIMEIIAIDLSLQVISKGSKRQPQSLDYSSVIIKKTLKKC